MIQITRTIVENDEDNTFIHCLYSNRTQHDILLKPQLDQHKTSWNFTITYALSRSSQESVTSDRGKLKYGDEVRHGRVDEELIRNEFSAVFSAEPGGVVLICGTKSFDKDMINFLYKINPNTAYFKF